MLKIVNLTNSWNSYDCYEVAKNIVKRIETKKFYNMQQLENKLRNAMDDELIYEDDRWEIMKEYQHPEDANYDEAETYFFDEILNSLELEEIDG